MKKKPNFFLDWNTLKLKTNTLRRQELKTGDKYVSNNIRLCSTLQFRKAGSFSLEASKKGADSNNS